MSLRRSGDGRGNIVMDRNRSLAVVRVVDVIRAGSGARIQRLHDANIAVGRSRMNRHPAMNLLLVVHMEAKGETAVMQPVMMNHGEGGEMGEMRPGTMNHADGREMKIQKRRLDVALSVLLEKQQQLLRRRCILDMDLACFLIRRCLMPSNSKLHQSPSQSRSDGQRGWTLDIL